MGVLRAGVDVSFADLKIRFFVPILGKVMTQIPLQVTAYKCFGDEIPTSRMRSIHTRILISTLSPGRERKTKQATEVEGGLAQRLLWELPCPCNFQHYSSILSTASVSSNLPLLRILRADSALQCIAKTQPNEKLGSFVN